MDIRVEINTQNEMYTINVIKTIMELEDLISESSGVYFYGAGKVCEKILNYLSEKDKIKYIEDIFVTQETGIPIDKHGIEVHKYNISKSKSKLPIIITVSSVAIQKDILKLLTGNNSSKIYVLDKDFEKSIVPVIKNIKYSRIKRKIQEYVQTKNSSEMRADIRFFSLPYWDAYSPFSAVPCLVARLKQEGYKVEQVDLGILCMHWMIKNRWKEAASICVSKEFYNKNVSDYKKNPYDSYESFLKDMWFFHDSFFDVYLVKKSYFTMNPVQRRIVDAFYEKICDIDASDFVFEKCNNFFEEVDNYILSDFLEEIVSDEIITVFQNLPPIIGLSVTSTAQFLPTCMFAKIIKEIWPDKLIIMGGSCADLFYKCQYDNKEDIYQYFDYIIVGEGETALTKLLNYLIKKNENYNEIPNLLHLNKEGQVVLGKQILEDVDTLPAPCYEGLDLSLYLSPQPILPYQTSRGCHYGCCAFCNHDEKYRRSYRSKRMEKVVKELIDLSKEYNVENFQFVDEAIRPDCFQEMVNKMDEFSEFKSINWFFYSRVSRRYDRKLLEKAVKNGCRMVMFGVESFNQRLLNFIKKGISAETSKYCLKLFHECGIKTYAWLMCNLPSETLQEAREDLDIVHRMERYIDEFSVAPFFLSRNTDMYNEPEKYNIISVNEMEPIKFMSHYEDEIIDKEAMLQFYVHEYLKYQMECFSTGNRYTLFWEGIME